ncbi:MAG: hypothetical protein GX282_02605 [Campylobacteraceae bacterium]|nr:hypothetical protein [Campylobacteraceae bacterium]
MSLAKKLYDIGSLVTDDEFIELLKVDFNPADYATLFIDFTIKDGKAEAKLQKSSLDNTKTLFTKAIGGRGLGYYYLYPNFKYDSESDLYKKFKNSFHTFEKSVLVFGGERNHDLIKPVVEYIKNYNQDELGLKSFDKGNYLLVFGVNGKTIRELMPEISSNFASNAAFLHSDLEEKEAIDYISGKKELCGYNPDVKFFTYDNYHKGFKPQILDKLPLSKQSATCIKKGWIYTINNLRFYHKGLEYIIIPSLLKFDEVAYKKILNGLKRIQQSTKNLEEKSIKEDSFIRRLEAQSEGLVGNAYLDIYFTELNLTNLSVRIFGSMEDLLPSKIREVGSKMMKQKVCDYYLAERKKEGYLCLGDYFSKIELFTSFTKSSLPNKVLQEKIYLAKLFLGYEKIEHKELLDKFEHYREYDFENKKKLTDEGVKNWIEYSDSFVENEDRTLEFLGSINAIKRS